MKLDRGVGIAALLLAVVALGTSPASAAPPAVPLPECASPTDPGALAPGQGAVGFTVRRGEVVEAFDVEIAGVLANELGPGRDLIVVEADSAAPVIAEGGISAGMSGSPVYTLDGDLIGAIGYGFSLGKSPIAGVTPAPDMLALAAEPIAASGPVALAGELRQRARVAGTSREALARGMRPLPLPATIAGLRPERVAALAAASRRAGLPFEIADPGPPGRAAAPAPAPLAATAEALTPTATLEPGDAFAAELSYGDAALSAIGTTAYVCDDVALAFGHPFLFTGRTLLGAGRAEVLAIVDDPNGPYKLAQPTDPAGIVDRDRLAAIRAQVGAEIPTMPVLQDTVALDRGESRLGARTDIVRSIGDARLFLPDIALTHALGNIDVVFDQVSGGSSRIAWTLRGTRKGSGEPWRLRRANRFSSGGDVSFATVLELYEHLTVLITQRHAPIELDGLEIEVGVEEEVRGYRIGRVLWATPGRRFRAARSLRVGPGQRIRARVRLRDPGSGATRVRRMSFRAPRRPGGGLITIAGGRGGFFDELDDEEIFFCAAAGGCKGIGPRADGFDQLLSRLRRQPRNDQLVGRARFPTASRKVVRQVDRVVSGFRSVRVTVRRRG